jgi:hypothetical protein
LIGSAVDKIFEILDVSIFRMILLSRVRSLKYLDDREVDDDEKRDALEMFSRSRDSIDSSAGNGNRTDIKIKEKLARKGFSQCHN